MIIPIDSHADNPFPIVVWISFDAPGEMEQQQYQAILAQFSGMQVELVKEVVSSSDMKNDLQKTTIERIATMHNASLVFWAESTHSLCRTYYYLPDSASNIPLKRELILESDTPESRQEFIAIAVAGMVRRLQVTHKIRPRPPEPPKEEKKQPKPKTSSKAQNVKKEIQVSYEGMVVSPDILVHGIQVAGWFTPRQHFTLGISLTPFFPSEYQTEELVLTLFTRNIAVSAAGLMKIGNVNIRLGARWVLDIRSYRTEPNRTPLTEHHNATNAIHSIAPFASAGYYFSKRFGFVVESAALIALNDRFYKMTVGAEEVLIQRPFPIKLNIIAGLTICFP